MTSPHAPHRSVIIDATLSSGECVDIVIEDGLIAEVGSGLSVSKHAGNNVIDASGLTALPGAIDPHVHFNEPGERSHWEGWDTGSAAAAAGGITTVVEMPLNASPPTVDVAAFNAKVVAAQRSSRVDFGLWGGVIPGNRTELPALAEAGVVGFKAFMSTSGSDDFPAADDLTLYEAMQTIAEFGLPLLLHAENDRITAGLAARARAAGRVAVQDYLDSRPAAAETEAIARAIELATVTGCALHIVHVSTARGVDLVNEARGRGVNVTCEVTPHHLMFSDADAIELGAVAKCAPPLRPPGERQALWHRIRDDHTIFVASDHSPAPPELKVSDDAFEIWGGIAGVQSTLELMLTFGLFHHGLNLADIERTTATAAADRFRLAGKGRLEVGYDADVVLVDIGPTRLLERDELLDRHRFSPYVGMELSARVRKTLVRGRVVFCDGVTAPGGGQLLKPSILA